VSVAISGLAARLARSLRRLRETVDRGAMIEDCLKDGGVEYLKRDVFRTAQTFHIPERAYAWPSTRVLRLNMVGNVKYIFGPWDKGLLWLCLASDTEIYPRAIPEAAYRKEDEKVESK
jgi:hypothetical protein